ncbi:NfeD family protein [Seohaeicola zhoushanensis]|uniref:NfeD family protein n=1 Tax=Seohaeicola zhoushanensis TaxID=1569283 RepID=A0A8J3GXR5_9RHOB|nr:hypothetical protein [Seohaeicola zhoushanensis]GHF53461.1 hypothetical protein GCM10017056_26340 [Seohaeicola zhoushanensis]
MLWQTWWVWMGAALVLAILEMVLPGFVLLGFAIGAFGIALMILIGITPSLPVMLFVWAGLALAAWLVLRRIFMLPKGQVKRFNTDINE